MAEFRHETERLVLRDWREGDAEEFFRITNTPAVMRWLGGVLDESGRTMQIERVTNCHAANGFCFWIVERREDGAMLGFCGLKRADAPGSSIPGEFEIGWRFREDCWGEGYAKEAASAALDLAFGRFAAREVYALTVDGNAPSWGLMKRLGMTRRESLDYEDSRYGADLNPTIFHSIAAADWKATKS